MRRTWLIVGFLILAFHSPAVSEPGEPPASTDPEPAHVSDHLFEIGLFGGGKLISDENELGNSFASEQVPGHSFLFGIRASYPIWRQIGALGPSLDIEAEGAVAIGSTGSTTNRDSFTTSVFSWRGHGQLSLWTHKKLSPFILAGVGGETLYTKSSFVDNGDTDFAAHWGIGARYNISPRLGLRLDLRHAITAARTKSASHFGEAHLGLSYRFLPPREPTLEHRVIAESPPPRVVAAPRRRAPDKDKDGIPDRADLCPEQPETINQIDDRDGCPEADPDGDGLIGKADRCPNAAEDKDRFQDEDGCPDLDNDDDGRPDSVDKCPDQPETINRFQDEDGCPDTIPKRVATFVGIIQGIRFRSGSTSITGSSRTTLDSAVIILNQYPSIRLLVIGHTDSRGNARTNLAISRKRADRVKWYLVDKGIRDDRIETIGFGDVKPVASNKTASGRRQNRRIEFQLLPPMEKKPEGSAAAGAR